MGALISGVNFSTIALYRRHHHATNMSHVLAVKHLALVGGLESCTVKACYSTVPVTVLKKGAALLPEQTVFGVRNSCS